MFQNFNQVSFTGKYNLPTTGDNGCTRTSLHGLNVQVKGGTKSDKIIMVNRDNTIVTIVCSIWSGGSDCAWRGE